MKKVVIIGAGKMTKPMVDYFIDICKKKENGDSQEFRQKNGILVVVEKIGR
jgi:pyrroline-5-carboxylate reductase